MSDVVAITDFSRAQLEMVLRRAKELEKTGGYFDDATITTKVKAEIFQDASLKSSEINVETFKGVVQLSGFVNSQADINKAVSLARSVDGVVSVKNDMRLK